jgi:hypothetical protein
MDDLDVDDVLVERLPLIQVFTNRPIALIFFGESLTAAPLPTRCHRFTIVHCPQCVLQRVLAVQADR